MFATMGLALAGGMASAAAEPASVRIDLVAVVPVTCSTGVIVQQAETSQGIEASLAGSCNAPHVVRVIVPEDLEDGASATLNGARGVQDERSFSFQRTAYFSSVSVLRINVGNAAAAPKSLRIEISPV